MWTSGEETGHGWDKVLVQNLGIYRPHRPHRPECGVLQDFLAGGIAAGYRLQTVGYRPSSPFTARLSTA
jgi:hypothetical protein